MHRRLPDAREALLAVSLMAALAAGLAACGDDGEPASDSPTRLQEALDGLGSGVSPTGTGFGWADLAALSGHSLDRGFAADALGPGADDLLDDQPAIRDATGIAPGGASQALSIQGSYALGVRFDGLGSGRLAALLRSAGASGRQDGSWRLYDLGRPAESEPGGPLRPFGALISRVAIGPESAAAGGGALVLSRFEGARASLTGSGAELELEGTRVEAAAECLGEVAAARLVPGTFTHDVPESPRLIGFGVRAPAAGIPPEEVLCAVEDTEAAADRRAEALRRAFADGATDAVSGEPVAELAEAEEVGTRRIGDFFVTRAVLRRPEGSRPGLLFDAFVRGSLLAYLGADRPIPSSAAP